MKKPVWQTDAWLDPWRKARAAEGSVGLALLAEVLNWNPDRVELSHFKERTRCHEVLRKMILETKLRNEDYGEKNDWRESLRSIQSEFRNDLLSLLEPVQLSEEEFRYWRGESGPRVQQIIPPVDENNSPRLNRLMILTTKLKSFHWERGISAALSSTLRFMPSLKSGSSLPLQYWNAVEGEHTIHFGVLEIDGERLIVQEEPPSCHDMREVLYLVVYMALLKGKFKLRLCKNQGCRKFFVPAKGGGHCSERCRIICSNKDRSDKYFSDWYDATKDKRLTTAKEAFQAVVRARGKIKRYDLVNDTIDSARDKILTGKAAPIGAKKEFKKFVEKYREKLLEGAR